MTDFYFLFFVLFYFFAFLLLLLVMLCSSMTMDCIAVQHQRDAIPHLCMDKENGIVPLSAVPRAFLWCLLDWNGCRSRVAPIIATPVVAKVQGCSENDSHGYHVARATR